MVARDLLILNSHIEGANFVFYRSRHCKDNARLGKCLVHKVRQTLAKAVQLHNDHTG